MIIKDIQTTKRLTFYGLVILFVIYTIMALWIHYNMKSSSDEYNNIILNILNHNEEETSYMPIDRLREVYDITALIGSVIEKNKIDKYFQVTVSYLNEEYTSDEELQDLLKNLDSSKEYLATLEVYEKIMIL